jgi:hypothetical protein
MEIKVKAYNIESLNKIEKLLINVDENKKKLIVGALKENIKRVDNIFKKLIKNQTIKSIRVRKNYKLQKEIDELYQSKKDMINSLDQIKTAFN